MKINVPFLATAVILAILAFSLSVCLLDDGLELLSQPAKKPQTALKAGGKRDSSVWLRSMDVQIEVTGNIASTRYAMVFQNGTDRVLEGTLTFPLPAGRSVTHYAIDIDGQMREGVPVEKVEGTRVFEAIQRRQVDPGLLERVEGNMFRTRVFPVSAGRTRTVSIGYEEELTLENRVMPSSPNIVNTFLRYSLPQIYSDSLEKFSVTAVWKGGHENCAPESEDRFDFYSDGEDCVASFTEENYRPARALTFALPAAGEAAHVTMQPAPACIPRMMTQPPPGNYYFIATAAPKLEARPKRWADDLAIIWDVSLSASQRDIERELEALNVIFAEKRDAVAHLYFLNNRLKKIYRKRGNEEIAGQARNDGIDTRHSRESGNPPDGGYRIINGNWDELRDTLKAAVFDGGTDFSQIKLDNVAGSEILFFSDGISTLGDADFLKNAAARRPVHCVVSSAKADYDAMRRIAAKTAGKFLDINALSAENLTYELRNETPLFLGVEHGGAVREVYPRSATPFYYESFSVAGISGADSAELTLLFGFGDKVEKRVKARLDAKGAIDSVNVHKIWAQKKLAELDLNFDGNRDSIMELGQKFGVVTRNVSLIVLETLEDYLRYNIIPPAEPADLLRRYSLLTRLNKLECSFDREDFAYLMSIPNVGQLSDAELKTEAARKHELWIKYWKHYYGEEFYNYVYNYRDEPPVGLAYLKNWLHGRLKSDAELNAEFQRVTALEKDTREGIIGQSEFIKRLYNPSLDDGAERDTRWRRAIDGAKRRWYSFWYGVLPPVIEYATSFFEKLPEERSARPVHTGEREPSINIKSVKKDNDYLNGLTGDAAEDYRIYLKLRDDYAYSPTFYLDMADWFYTHGDREAALRALTSVAELDYENASLYRALGYRLKEYGEYALEKFVCQKVVEWRPTDAHGYREYALALADNGEAQAALDSLYSLFTKMWQSLYWAEENLDFRIINGDPDIMVVLVTEMNRLVAQNPRLNTSILNDCMIKTVPVTTPVPVDIRVVINWNLNDADIDLHIKDPNGEECGKNVGSETSIGGRLSGVVWDGNGPEQFMLKNAIKGKYGVYVNYYRGTADWPTTVMAEIFTKYADKSEQRKIVTLQLAQAKDENGKVKLDHKVPLAEFEF